ncbi:tripartite tricarboxylate transporter permease [Bradyrhizobium sp. SSUT112]|uniref:tripartite tricarboxylate transporter permease n=1 Tax=Bradyrhizobium sp. SSUT112 TaxID=3040604 RepID=UPI0024483584|nr:tripartite tricarboxylate transporter permease [Bradyrhizobium sp. SSUT112]MDH2353360.1 tripartite tricarboxylate transporter permease [Bradyrhizobium sp. SSUT112]
MDLFHNLALGFSTAAQPANLLYAFFGCLLGTLIGVLPGLGPLATIAMLLPITYALPPDAALIMLAGIYYGAQYGGSTTAIVVNLPGESSSVVTTIDGYQMAKQGRAGVALSTAAIGSFFAGCVATLALAALAGPLTAAAMLFGPKEFFALMILGLILASVLSNGPFIEGIGMVALGMLLSLVGTDLSTGTQRFAFGIPQLLDGLDFVPLAMGIFGFAEIVKNLEQDDKLSLVTQKIANLFPTREDFRRMIPAILRGTALGTLLGVLPGGGAVLSSFASYTLEKKLSKYPEQFGKGAIEGVAGPESANNAGAQTSFIPLLTLGVPSNVVMALMVGAMNIHNIQPGPQVMTKNPTLFWGLIASMWVGNLMLLILNLPLVGLWVKLLTIPYRYLFPAIMVFCSIGVYSINSGTFEVYEAAVFCAFGYLLIKLQLPAAPLLLGLVLGPAIEENFRRAMVLSRGDATVFLTSPLSAALLAAAAIAVILIMLPTIRTRREEALQE